MGPDDGDTVTDVADDDIVSGRIVLGLKALRDHLGCSLHEAIDVFAARYEVLRRERPADFSKSPEEYGAGFHS